MQPTAETTELLMLGAVWAWLGPMLLTALYGVVGYSLFRWAAARSRRRLRRRGTLWEDALGFLMGWPLALGLVLGGAAILVSLWPLDPATRRFFGAVLRIVLVIGLVAGTQQWLLRCFSASAAGSWLRIPLLRQLTLITLYVVALLTILSLIGISVLPTLTALGVGSLAVALALRELLANFFAGIRLNIDRPIEPGQVIRLETGQSGEVLQVGWMRTHLRLPDASLLIVPNARLLESIVQNFSQGGSGALLEVVFVVDREADLDAAERAVRRELERMAALGEGVWHAELAWTRLSGPGAELTVSVHGSSLATLHAARSGVVKNVAAALREAGIRLV